MKIESDMKSSEDTSTESAPGEYTQEDLGEMLETVMKAKEIQSDEKVVRLLKDYAISKAKMVDQLFINPQKDAMVGLDKIKMKAQSKANILAGDEEED
jgi:hypothetical protein